MQKMTENILRELKGRKERGRLGKFTERGCEGPNFEGCDEEDRQKGLETA